jgi:hypothetical protein
MACVGESILREGARLGTAPKRQVFPVVVMHPCRVDVAPMVSPLLIVHISPFVLTRNQATPEAGTAPQSECHSPVPQDLYSMNPAVRPTYAPTTPDMSSSAYYWEASRTCSSTDDSLEESQARYLRAPPTPQYQSPMSSFHRQPMSPVALHCVLPNGQTVDLANRRIPNETSWPL